MCQGHQHAGPNELTNLPSSSSGQSSQLIRKPKQKVKSKQQKQQLAKESTPATPAQPTYEIVKSGSAKLANGTRYVDVSPLL